MKIRLTNTRREILKILGKVQKPLNAKTIIRRISSRPNLSTVYRALDFLESKKYIHSVSFSGVKFFFAAVKGNGHFLVCKECHEILEFSDCVAENLQKKIQRKFGYTITDHVLYFKGLCSECQNYLNKKNRLQS